MRSWRGTESALKAWHATYEGTPQITLTIFEMPLYPGGAFDALQKWHPQPGTMAFFKDRYFGVAESPVADEATLHRFVHAVAASLPGRAEMVR